MYAHGIGLGIFKGLAGLAVLAAVVFAVEHFGSGRHEAYYWLVIILIRKAATDIADYLAFRVRIPPLALTLGLVALLCLFDWGTYRGARIDSPAVLNTNTAYWLAMLTAGVCGTVVGDLCSHAVGHGVASLILGTVLLAVLLAGRGRAATLIPLYQTTVEIARTAGTAMGDWIAENKILNIGLPISTLISGTDFVALLLLWRSSRRNSPEHDVR